MKILVPRKPNKAWKPTPRIKILLVKNQILLVFSSLLKGMSVVNILEKDRIPRKF